MYKCEENAMCDVGNVSFIKKKKEEKYYKE